MWWWRRANIFRASSSGICCARFYDIVFVPASVAMHGRSGKELYFHFIDLVLVCGVRGGGVGIRGCKELNF